MKKVIGFAAAFALCATTQAFAIAGVGAHYVMNLGSELKGKPGKYNVAIGGEERTITVRQESADGLQGLGFKAWLDILPVIDIEGTLNIAATRYSVSLDIPKLSADGTIRDTTIRLEYEPEAPFGMFGKASPLYGMAYGDLSITYPFTDIPFIRPYLGAGISYFASIPIINASLAEKIVNKDIIDGLLPSDPDNFDPDAAKGLSDKVNKNLQKTLENESYKSGIGAHLIAGFRIQLLFFAVYVNGKYYLGGNIEDQFSNGFVLEAGGGLAL